MREVRPLVLVATSLAAFTATLDNTVVAVALRDVQADLGAGVAELQGVVTAYTVALAALLLTGGTLADVAGRRRVLLAGLAVFAAASAACALSDSAGQLIAARAVQGVGAALVLPGGLAVLAAAYPEPGRRARA
ncbi:MAG: transporter, partial [Frankiales bacterium]|nr:transporter [Frankiales bacterium]